MLKLYFVNLTTPPPILVVFVKIALVSQLGKWREGPTQAGNSGSF